MATNSRDEPKEVVRQIEKIEDGESLFETVFGLASSDRIGEAKRGKAKQSRAERKEAFALLRTSSSLFRTQSPFYSTSGKQDKRKRKAEKKIKIHLDGYSSFNRRPRAILRPRLVFLSASIAITPFKSTRKFRE